MCLLLRRRMAGLALLVAAAGCNGRPRDSVAVPTPPPAVALAVAGAPGGSGADAATVPAAPGPPSAGYVVDETGMAIRGVRVEARIAGDEKALRALVAQAPAAAGPAVIHAARGASLRRVSALARVLGQTGVPEIDVVTPANGAEGAGPVLKLSPLGQVPMQRDACGALITIKADNTGELKYLQKGRPVKLPQTPDGPDGSAALRNLRERMKGCASTVWMLAGEGAALWGPAFHVGITVTSAAKPPEKTRYTLLL